MKRQTWYVWDAAEQVLFQGSRTKCLSWYKRHRGDRMGLTLGYLLGAE